jgi:L-fuconolactonase
MLSAKNNSIENCSRRDFSCSLLALASGALLPAASHAAAPQQEPLEIIDTHQHLWDLKQFRLEWLKGNATLEKNFVTADYLAASEGLNIRRAVYMEVDVVPEQQADEAEWVIGLCKGGKTPTVAAVIGGDLLKPEFATYIHKFAESPYIKGVRHIVAGLPGDSVFQDDRFLSHIKLLRDRKLRFDLCTRPDQLPADMQFILDHCGNPDYMAFLSASQRTRKADHEPDVWKKGLAEIAKQENVVCKLSGIIAKVDKEAWKPSQLAPIIEHCVDCFGVDRVIFASDWPVCLLGATLKEWVEALKELTLQYGSAVQHKIFSRNAERIYALK